MKELISRELFESAELADLLKDRRRYKEVNKDIFKYLTFTALDDNVYIGLAMPGGLSTYEYAEFSIDNGITWTKITVGDSFLLQGTYIKKGKSMLWRGKGTNMGNGSSPVVYKGYKSYIPSNYPTYVAGEVYPDFIELIKTSSLYNTINHCQFIIKGKTKSSGNIMSLLEPEEFYTLNTVLDYCFASLFSMCTDLVSAPLLPAVNLGQGAYSKLFECCTSLLEPPELPALELSSYCYSRTFWHCHSFRHCPELPATVLNSNCYSNLFEGCISITEPCELPALTMLEHCYDSMFREAINLLSMPILPSKNLASNCYIDMFRLCTNLTGVHDLPALTLYANCYYRMFESCTKLINAPEIEAVLMLGASCCYQMFSECTSLINGPSILKTIKLTAYCYSAMFQSCFNLINPPVLCGRILSSSCYLGMFLLCSSLLVAPELIADTLAIACYSKMFSGCTSLVEAPILKASTLVLNCYVEIFMGCTSLTSITVLATNNISKSFLKNWVKDTDYSNLIIYSEDDNDGFFLSGFLLSLPSQLQNSAHVKAIPDYSLEYFTTIALEDNTTFKGHSSSIRRIAYSLDKRTWYTNISSPTIQVTVNSGLKVYWQGTLLNFTKSFRADKSYKVEGNLMSLCNADNFISTIPNRESQFAKMFSGQTNLVDASNLVLPSSCTENCYLEMFKNCINLRKAPELSGSLEVRCYYKMFEGCSNLLIAPDLLETSLYEHCYEEMFKDCSNLVVAPILSASLVSDYSYYFMFKDCSKLSGVIILAEEVYNGLRSCLSGVNDTGIFYKSSLMSEDKILSETSIPNSWIIEDY